MKPIPIVLLSLVLTGCAGSLQTGLASRTGDLLYLHDSEAVTDKQGDATQLGTFVVDDILPPATTVDKTGMFILPLIVWDSWKINYQSRLGAAQVTNDYKQFIKDRFIDELKRSGRLPYAEDNGAIEIDVHVKNLTMSAPIVHFGYFLFALYVWAFGQYTVAGPVDVVVTADIAAKKDGRELLSREVRGESRTNSLDARYTAESKLLTDFQAAMIEGTSMAIKNLNENLVREINTLVLQASAPSPRPIVSSAHPAF
ncbi:MAG: hypothetical protein HY208_07685 [Nitrospirae bacterium]|nr:hypothetical protein [Nitrospirota bacterium]